VIKGNGDGYNVVGLFMTMCARRYLFESYPTFGRSLLTLGKILVFYYQLSFSKSKVTAIYAIKTINEMANSLTVHLQVIAHVLGGEG